VVATVQDVVQDVVQATVQDVVQATVQNVKKPAQGGLSQGGQ
jgi:hypothetical protein